MKMIKTINYLLGLVVALLGGVTATTQAQVTIFSENMESHISGGSTPGYHFGDYTNDTHTYQAGAGVGGSIGAVVLSDFQNPPVGYYGGVAYQYQNGNVGGANTSPNMSDYTLSFDVEVNKANGGFALILQTWAGTFFSGAFSQSQYPSEITLAVPTVFQHYTLNLGSFPSGLVPTGQTWQVAFQMDEYTYGVPSSGDQLVIDNVVLTMVPEPSALALGGLAAAAFGCLRRKKS
jgi:hypothetical protein